jgi:hypothetical protein
MVEIWDSACHFIHIVTDSFLNVGWTRASHRLIDSVLNQGTNPQENGESLPVDSIVGHSRLQGSKTLLQKLVNQHNSNRAPSS